jgi:hypothetical protein
MLSENMNFYVLESIFEKRKHFRQLFQTTTFQMILLRNKDISDDSAPRDASAIIQIQKIPYRWNKNI